MRREGLVCDAVKVDEGAAEFCTYCSLDVWGWRDGDEVIEQPSMLRRRSPNIRTTAMSSVLLMLVRVCPDLQYVRM